EDKTTKLINIKLDKEETFILPLNFGKRYAREYLYNHELNFANKGITLNNARIIKEGVKYFVAITFTKLKGNILRKDSDLEYKAIIGVDRGEILPVAVAITDIKGNEIEKPELEICKLFAEKQKSIDQQKKLQSSRIGRYDDNLKRKAKNLSKATIEKIGAELLYYATKYRALIVLEDLSREFGVNPIMATRQYSKIEDFLSRKLKENGLIRGKGKLLTNTRDGLLAKVVARYTSKTCCKCGFVFSTEKIKLLKPYLNNGVYYVNLDRKEISLDINYKKWIKEIGKNEKFNADEEIKRLKEKNIKKNQELIEKVLLNSLNPRKTQEEFKCPICGHIENADEQAALNIARRWIFKDSDEGKEYKNKKDKIKYFEAWENFCKKRKNEWNQND
ncbi:MAG: hypothetical protein LBC92_05825, partial [Rickettsiales bacterium]|nr:hypothetical protein [Rickettsiales bacterium]